MFVYNSARHKFFIGTVVATFIAHSSECLRIVRPVARVVSGRQLQQGDHFTDFGLQFYNYLDERGHPVMARAHNALDEVDSIPIESSCKYGWTNCANHRSEF